MALKYKEGSHKAHLSRQYGVVELTLWSSRYLVERRIMTMFCWGWSAWHESITRCTGTRRLPFQSLNVAGSMVSRGLYFETNHETSAVQDFRVLRALDLLAWLNLRGLVYVTLTS